MTRLVGYTGIYDFRRELNLKHNHWFAIEDECTNGCEPKAGVIATTNEYPTDRTQLGYPAYIDSPEEIADLQNSLHIKEKISAKDYTGNGRVLPNPMQYKTDSWLVKLGYHFSPQHYLGEVLEHTKQQYDIRDMTVPAYYLGADRRSEPINRDSKVIYRHHYLDGMTYGKQGLRWARTQFFDEGHKKVRQGLIYKFNNQNKNGWGDNAKLSYDYQLIQLDSALLKRHCSEYPNVDKNCTVSLDKTWSYAATERNQYQEKHHLIQLNLEKKLNTFGMKHQLSSLFGMDKFQSTLNRLEYSEQYAYQDWIFIKGKGT